MDGKPRRSINPATNACDPENVMKLILGIAAGVVIAASLFADYKWRRWMADRRRDRER
jgi:hypothetical protein